jgi:hypothetical protein
VVFVSVGDFPVTGWALVEVPEDRLGVGGDRLEVDQVEVTDRGLASVMCDDRPYLRVAQERVELIGDLRRTRRAPSVLPLRLEQGRKADAESHPLEHGDRELEVGLVDGVERTGQRRDDDEISGA